MNTLQQIQRFQYISFDVFDTLIKRSVAQPSDLFALMETMGAPQGFAYERKQAEHFAWEKLGRSVTLDEIYAELRERNDDSFAQMKELELELELSGCRANPDCVKLLRQCVDAGKTVVLISDMYLSSATIAVMLKKCGISGYNKLYVSCEYGANKRSGGLYKAALKDMGIRPEQLLHIGDNRKSDFLKPVMMGIHAIWIKNDQKKMCHIPRRISPEAALVQRTMHACIRNTCKDIGTERQQGCAVFGPLLYGFTVWLMESLRRDGINEVCFLAREGLIMKRAFDMFRLSGITTHYLYGSRRAFVVPILWKHLDFEDMFQYIFYFKKCSLKAVLERWGLNPEDYKDIAQTHQLDIETSFSREVFFTSEKIRSFYKDIQEDIELNSKREYEAMLAYINSLNLAKKIAFVDIGYNGTMQSAFIDFLKVASLDIDVHGYYVGIEAEIQRFTGNKLNASAYLYDLERNEDYGYEVRRFRGIFEIHFLAPHGSVKRFVLRDGEGIPELYEYEYDSEREKLIDEKKLTEDIQDGAIAFIQYLLNAFHGRRLKIQPEIAFYPFRRLGLKPKLSEAKLWGDVRFFNFNEVKWLAVPPKITDLGKCIWNPRYRHTQPWFPILWKVGFMKRMLWIPLPYAQIEIILRRIVNRRKRVSK